MSQSVGSYPNWHLTTPTPPALYYISAIASGTGMRYQIYLPAGRPIGGKSYIQEQKPGTRKARKIRHRVAARGSALPRMTAGPSPTDSKLAAWRGNPLSANPDGAGGKCRPPL